MNTAHPVKKVVGLPPTQDQDTAEDTKDDNVDTNSQNHSIQPDRVLCWATALCKKKKEKTINN